MISFGMMWCEVNPKNAMLQTISSALEFYAKKYPHKPANLIVVHPRQFDPDIQYPVDVSPWQYVLPNHVIVGIAEEKL